MTRTLTPSGDCTPARTRWSSPIMAIFKIFRGGRFRVTLATPSRSSQMMLSAIMVRDSFDELSHSLDDRCRLIAMGRMTALLKFKHFHPGDRSRDAVDLFHSSVL